MFYNKVHHRVLDHLLAAPDRPPAPVELRHAITTIDRVVDRYLADARLGTAA